MAQSEESWEGTLLISYGSGDSIEIIHQFGGTKLGKVNADTHYM